MCEPTMPCWCSVRLKTTATGFQNATHTMKTTVLSADIPVRLGAWALTVPNTRTRISALREHETNRGGRGKIGAILSSRWKTAIHDEGWSSPVVWGDQIWVTSGRKDGSELFALCVDLKSGAVVHDLKVFDVPEPQKAYEGYNTHATPTPIIEEGHIYVHFGAYGTACLSMNRREGPRVAVPIFRSATRRPSRVGSWSQCMRVSEWRLSTNRPMVIIARLLRKPWLRRHFFVAQSCTLLYRRIAFGRRGEICRSNWFGGGLCRFQTCDTAECNSALREGHSCVVHLADSSVTVLT